MATKFPKFNCLANDPDNASYFISRQNSSWFEKSWREWSKKALYKRFFALTFYKLAIIFLWRLVILFHVACKVTLNNGTKPLSIRPIAHAIWDPHFITRSRSCLPEVVLQDRKHCDLTKYQWWYAIGGALKPRFIHCSVFLALGATAFLFAGWSIFNLKFQPGLLV
jgi:photosystem I P700 chlorophyll a apoprotein A2